MTPTNTDYLLQVTTPVTDRAYGAAGAGDGASKFDDHLSQASTYSGDDSRNLGSGSQRTDTARYERDDRSWNTGTSKPNSHDSGNSTSSQTSQSSQEGPSDGVRGPTSATEDTDIDERDAEKSDDATAAEVAGAGQATKDNSTKSGSKAEPNANASAPATAKAAAANKKAAAEAADRKAAGIGDGQGTGGSTSPHTATQHADEAAKLAAKTAADTSKTSDEASKSQASDSEGKQSKAAKGDATGKSNKGSNIKNDGAINGNPQADGTEIGEAASTATKKASENVDPSTGLASATTKSKSDADDSSDDDSHTGSKNDSRAGLRNDASVPTKVDTAQLAGGTPSTTDAIADASSKSKDNDQATKPIVAKGEPAAAAFARMARNNITGSNDSASGANDLPQIDPSRFIGRVAKAFQTAQDRGGTLQLRLSPPELGALRIELNVKDGVMSASLQTETANARRLLLDHLPALRDRLAEQNIRVDRFDVDVRQEGSGSQADTRGSQQQQFQHQPDQPTPRRHAPPPVRAREVAAPERTVAMPSVSDTGLNLIV